MSNIQEKIQKELQEARAVCSKDGTDSAACAAAYDVVEELQAEASHQREAQPVKNSLQAYCDANPDAAECRLYED